MDRFDAMRLFVRIVECQSFTQAASDLCFQRSTATRLIAELESRLGVQLLQRTTRIVRPTPEGESFNLRCKRILEDLEEAESSVGGRAPKGQLRVEVQGTLARHFLFPGLPDFLKRNPALELSIGECDRWVDFAKEGVECVLRYGHIRDCDLVAKRVANLERVTCAAPEYLLRFGTPNSLGDLGAHCVVGLRSFSTGMIKPLEFREGQSQRSIALKAALTVTGTESYLAGIRLGIGLAQVPRFHVATDLGSGRLVQILKDTPPPSGPVHILYSRARRMSPRLRAFVDWAASEFIRRDASDSSKPAIRSTLNGTHVTWAPSIDTAQPQR